MSRIWENALATLEGRLKPHHYDLWIRPIICTQVSADEITLRAPDPFLRSHFSLNYLPIVLAEIENQTRLRYKISFVDDDMTASDVAPVAPEAPPAPALPPPESASEAADAGPNSVDRSAVAGDFMPRYVFDSFVVGPSNQLAHAAARAVAEHPAGKWNPLYIYGGVGLGKTHLLMAIGHEIQRRHPGWRVTYVSTERFVNEYINALPTHTHQEFRRRYREDCDVLLVDDVQFLAGKERTQDEFFHTFNSLYQAPKQIVLTSDRMPHEIDNLAERLSSRFQCGLIADIQRPDLETRTAILRRKAQLEGFELPMDVALFIAARVKSSVRELEGSLIRAAAYASIHQLPMSIDLVISALGDLIGANRRSLTMDTIIKDVADHFQVKVADLKGARRHQAIAWPRQVAMYLCYHLLQDQKPRASFPAVAAFFGGRDHTTVLSAHNKVAEKRKNDPAVLSVLESLERRLTQ